MVHLSEDRRWGDGSGPRFANPYAVYLKLTTQPSGLARRDPFTAHVFACTLCIGVFEARAGDASVGISIGLDRRALAALIERWAPGAVRYVDLEEQPETISFDEDEGQLRALLERFRGDSSEETDWLVSIVARRSMSPRHLWQDLGLTRRAELTRLMSARFPALAARNRANMKWKKFFYRCLCELEGFVLCAAPTCCECNDFSNCFGDEAGESALARMAHDVVQSP
ncbi:MAG: nitrogen fixation protein NifQ [Methylocystis sp.]|nr:nitrogen fixation protein NifQ [Methylocystis sp.]